MERSRAASATCRFHSTQCPYVHISILTGGELSTFTPSSNCKRQNLPDAGFNCFSATKLRPLSRRTDVDRSL